MEALHRRHAAQAQERLGASDVSQRPRARVLPGHRSAHRRHADWLAWQALLREAGAREVRLHDVRHTAATLLISAGVQLRVVMELLGHFQMRTTTDTYSHVLPAPAQEAASSLNKALWG